MNFKKETKIKVPKNDYQQFIWNVITEIGIQERHFNNLESEYRKLASTWLLAYFAAIGFIMATNAIVIKELFVIGISIAAAIGIFLLWMIDLLVYHQLLHACFEVGKKLEVGNPWLPQIRKGMIFSVPHGDVTSRVVWFYIIGTSIPLFVACLLVNYWIYLHLHGKILSIVDTFLWCFFIVILGRIMYYKTLKENKSKNDNQ